MDRSQKSCDFRYIGALWIISMSGCGGPSYQFAEVHGRITFENIPLAGAVVRFSPISTQREQLPAATGMTDETGSFILTHGKDEPGALVGPNRVIVAWPSRHVKEHAELARGKPFPPPVVDIPVKYTVLNETPLFVEVKAGEPQTINLELKDID